MEYGYLKIRMEGAVAVVSIDNPPVNALSFAVLDSLEAVMNAFVGDVTVKALIITGEGRFFSAGADIRELDTFRTASQGEEMVRKAQWQLDRLESLPIPVIAAINGLSIGGGNELAMACHIRIAAESAKLGQPEINLGIIPGFGGSQRLPRLVGKARALEMLLTGDPVSAVEAKQIGLVNRVAADDDLMNEALALAGIIAGKSRTALAYTLDAVRRGMETTLAEAQTIEAELFGKICETDDKEEGVRAFFEKRKANFS